MTFNDDTDPDNDVLDSTIADFDVSTNGTYILVVSHPLGDSEGDIEILVQKQ